jgi:hypothetical protein
VVTNHRRLPLWGISVTFFIPVALALVVNHSPAIWSNGISYLGTKANSFPWIALGECGTAIFILLAASRWPARPELALAQKLMRAVAVALVGIAATPYTINAVFNWVHMSFGVVSALVQFALLYELLRRKFLLRPTWPLVALAGGVISALSLPDWDIHSMLIGEIVMEIGVAVSLARADTRI